MALSDIYQKASLVQIPSGYKADKLYSVVPNNGDGDFDFTRASTATRVNKDGLIETTVANQARLNYDPTNPQDPHLLLEPTRTNLITQLTELTSGALAKPDLTVSDNTSITDPQGGTDTKTLTATSTSQPRLEWRGTSVPASNTSYSMSFFVRYNTARYVAIAHFSQTGEYAIFDLVSGEVESDVGTQTAKIEAYPNGWYRVSKSFEVPSSASVNYWKFTLCTQTNAFVGVSGEKADVFGLQFEVGSYPTSYIPTSGSAVTRTADNCFINSGLQNILNTSEGTLFIDVEVPRVSTGSDYERIALTDQTSGTDRILIDDFGGNWRVVVISSAGTQTASIRSTQANTRIKIAFAYSSSQIRVSYDGNDATTTSISYTPSTTLESFKFSNKDGNNKWQGKIYQAMYFDTALTNAELKQLTT
jgi:hypothetical protein